MNTFREPAQEHRPLLDNSGKNTLETKITEAPVKPLLVLPIMIAACSGDRSDSGSDTASGRGCGDGNSLVTGQGSRLAAVSVGQGNACTLDSSGQISCWGDGGEDVPNEAPDRGCYTHISSGGGWGWYDFACALHADNTIDCWGFEEGAVDPPEGRFTAISAGGAHACALDEGGQIDCWGNEEHHASAIAAPAGTFESISSGWENTCAIDLDGRLSCWGDDRFGLVSDTPSGRFVDVSVNGLHACAISYGRATCWGGPQEDLIDDAPLDGTAVATTGDLGLSCTRTMDGAVTCRTSGWQAEPDLSAPEGTFTHFDAGLYTLCAFGEEADTLQCWGSDQWGLIGGAP